jgi:hydrogenase expression/formation protein HypE
MEKIMSDTVLLDHGSGGLASRKLLEEVIYSRLGNPALAEGGDSALLAELPPGFRPAFTTDSYVVDPLFFPGGDIGKLAVHGTINDLAMAGARPLALSLGLILEEGLEMETLTRVIDSIGTACKEAGVNIVTGDTKVVPRGKGDKIFINTSGIGAVASNCVLSPARIREGDAVLLSGTLGDHGITIMTRQAGVELQGDLQSDTRPLHRLSAALLEKLGGDVHVMRDPTRGGVATVINELLGGGLALEVEETALPVRPQVQAACELLGLEPLYLANEGKMLAVVQGERAEEALAVLRSLPEGEEAVILGHIHREEKVRTASLILRTVTGGRRMVAPLQGMALPRIC